MGQYMEEKTIATKGICIYRPCSLTPSVNLPGARRGPKLSLARCKGTVTVFSIGNHVEKSALLVMKQNYSLEIKG